MVTPYMLGSNRDQDTGYREIFVVFLSTSRQMPIILRLGHDRFHPHTF
jgi:hypothetical protein